MGVCTIQCNAWYWVTQILIGVGGGGHVRRGNQILS